MGEVYRATDLELGVTVALKTLRPEIASDPTALRYFKQEVLLARSVSHPNVCRIYDLGRDAERSMTFLTMEYLQGETLTRRIERAGPLPVEEARRIVRHITDALDTAHRAGIVHRDLKSPNIMLVPDEDHDRAVIMDFGLAIASTPAPQTPGCEVAVRPDTGTTSELGVSLERGLTGTPAYMSPEQVSGESVGPPSDLYALGVILYEMTTGRLPFAEPLPLDTARARLLYAPPPPSTWMPVDPVWERVTLKLLSRDQADRFSTGLAVIEALEGRDGATQAIRHSLTGERDQFVGRVAELRSLAASLETPDGSGRLLTLLGPGGTGKTRAAIRYGWSSLSRWPGGVWFCDLSEARDIDGIVAAVARGLDVPLGPGSPVTQLGHAIAGHGRCLVILDNFEQVVHDASAVLEPWLDRCTEAAFLVTSRERLQLDGERIQILDPLDPATHAVELFEARAQTHRAGFAVNEANRAVVEDIVHRLDGIPLAIELATARLGMLSLEQLHERLADRLSLLSGGKRGRQSALRSTLDWSWDLLDPWEQGALRQASVFEGGFTLEAAEAVIDSSPHRAAPPVLDIIQSLVDKSWLRARVESSVPRFEMYALVHEYAADKLRQAEDPEIGSGSEQRHSSFFGAFGTEAALGTLEGPGAISQRRALALELDNLVAATRRACERGDGAVATRALVATWAVVETRGPFSLAVSLARLALTLPLTPAEEARARRTLGLGLHWTGRLDEALEQYGAALRYHRGTQDLRAVGMVLGNLGGSCQAFGRWDAAREHYEEALQIHRQVGNLRFEGIVLGNLATCYRAQGRMDEALECYERSLELCRQVGDLPIEALMLGNLGSFYIERGRLDDARRCLEQAVEIQRQVGDRRGQGLNLGNLGILHNQKGELDTAEACFEEALAIRRQVGDRRGEGFVLGNLAELYESQDRWEEAAARYAQSIAIHREVGNVHAEGFFLGNLGALLVRRGDTKEAHDALMNSLDLLRKVGDRLHEAIVLRSLGLLAIRVGDLDEATGQLTESQEILSDLGADLELAILHCVRGRLRLEAGDRTGAETELKAAHELGERLGVGVESPLGREVAGLRSALAGSP